MTVVTLLGMIQSRMAWLRLRPAMIGTGGPNNNQNSPFLKYVPFLFLGDHSMKIHFSIRYRQCSGHSPSTTQFKPEQARSTISQLTLIRFVDTHSIPFIDYYTGKNISGVHLFPFPSFPQA